MAGRPRTVDALRRRPTVGGQVITAIPHVLNKCTAASSEATRVLSRGPEPRRGKPRHDPSTRRQQPRRGHAHRLRRPGSVMPPDRVRDPCIHRRADPRPTFSHCPQPHYRGGGLIGTFTRTCASCRCHPPTRLTPALEDTGETSSPRRASRPPRRRDRRLPRWIRSSRRTDAGRGSGGATIPLLVRLSGQ